MQNGVDDWGPVRSTRGVAGVVRFGAQPAKVEDSLIDEIKAREAQWGKQTTEIEKFKNGQSVKIKSGPFKGLDAIFSNYSGGERVIIFLNVLSQRTRMTLNAKELICA